MNSWVEASVADVNPLLARRHYLGPMRSATRVHACFILGHEAVGAMVWRLPTSRRLPNDGTWLELSRWCLTPSLGENAGSRAHRQVMKLLRGSGVTTLVSYSDPSVGHTGALYRACNWLWSPTWHRLRPPPTGNGQWQKGKVQSVKDRWIFPVTTDPRRDALLMVDDPGAIRKWLRAAGPLEIDRAKRSAAVDLQLAATDVLTRSD